MSEHSEGNEENCKKRKHYSTSPAIPEETEQVDTLNPRVVDLKLITALQNELKYQVYNTWRQLNLIETYDENEFSLANDAKDDIITAMQYNKKVSERKLTDEVCCLKCYKHIAIEEFKTHMKFSHDYHGDITNCQSVPVLEMDTANTSSRISCAIIKHIELGDYFLFCRMCFHPVTKKGKKKLKKSLPRSIEDHSKSSVHKNKVKEFLNQSDIKNEELPLFLQLFQHHYDPSHITEVLEAGSNFPVYHPHEFSLSCCCRAASCRYCETSPYIFANIISPETKMIHCKVCNSPFMTNFSHHYGDIVKHATSKPHVLKRRELLAREGYVPPDRQLFVGSKI